MHSQQAKPSFWLSGRCVSIFLILALAAFLRLHGLGRQSLWYDESLTLESVRAPWSQVIATVERWENTPPTYFLLLNRWARVFGTSDFALRLPSALCGIGAVGMMYLFGRAAVTDERRGRWVGLFAAGLLAVSRYHIAYSQEARAYAPMFLLATLSCHAMAVLCRRVTRWAQWQYVLSSAAMLWMHPFSVFVLAAQGLFMLSRRGRAGGIPLRRWIVLQAAAVLLFGPWIPTAMNVASGGQPWMPRPHFIDTFGQYVNPWPALAALLLLAVAAGVFDWRRREIAGPFGLLLLALCAAVPILLSMGRHPLFTPRYGIPGLIGLYLAAAAGASLLGPRWGTVAIVLACLPTLPGLTHDARLGLNAQIKPAVNDAAWVIQQQATPGDVVWCHDFTLGRPLRKYLTKPGLTLTEDRPADDVPCVWLVRSGPLDDPAYDVERHWTFRRDVNLYQLRWPPKRNPATSRP